MKNKINYPGIAVMAILIIFHSCTKETNEVILQETPDNYNFPDDTLPSVSGIGTRLIDLPWEGRKYAVSFSIGSKIYIGFGFNQSGPVKDFWVWEGDTAITDWELSPKNMWTKLPDFPGSFSKSGITEGAPLGFSANGKGYVLPPGFYENKDLVNEFWEFDPENSVWTRKANPPRTLTRFFLTGFSIGTKIYIGTGESYSNNQWVLYNDFWEWDQTTDKWTPKATFPGKVRAHATGFSIGDKGYIGLGGEIGMGGGFLYKDFWEYNQATNTWTRKADFPGNQQIDAISFSVGNKGYVTAGWDPLSESTWSQDIWEWNQATDTWAKIGDFAGTPRTGALGGAFGNRGYILAGQNMSKDWESKPYLNDFWIMDLTSDR